jgi:hypothetical protein
VCRCILIIRRESVVFSIPQGMANIVGSRQICGQATECATTLEASQSGKSLTGKDKAFCHWFLSQEFSMSGSSVDSRTSRYAPRWQVERNLRPGSRDIHNNHCEIPVLPLQTQWKISNKQPLPAARA